MCLPDETNLPISEIGQSGLGETADIGAAKSNASFSWTVQPAQKVQ